MISGLILLAGVSASALAQPVPEPAPRPATEKTEAEAPVLPETVAKPTARPAVEDADPGTNAPKSGEESRAPDASPQPTPPQEAVGSLVPPAEMSCRAELKSMGAAFTVHAPLEDEGCGTPYPLSVTALADGIPLEPEAVLNCQTALAAAQFVRKSVAPQARRILGTELVGIRQASAYVCRPRRGGSKLSEHGLANAIDFSAFMFKDGRSLSVKAYGPGENKERAFMRRLRSAACGPFKTVLGPGTNADHADHLHLDLAQRRNGGTYCR